MSIHQPIDFGRRSIPMPPPPYAVPEASAHPASSVSCSALLRSDARIGAEEREMRRYIGDIWPSYRDLWLRMQKASEPTTEFSLAAFCFSAAWLLYRKLYVLAVTIIGAGLAIGFVAPKLALIFNLTSCVIIGLYGKSLVVQRATLTIADAHSRGLSPGETALRIEKAGGTNLFGSIVVTTVLLVVTVMAGVGGARQKPEPPFDELPGAVLRKSLI